MMRQARDIGGPAIQLPLLALVLVVLFAFAMGAMALSSSTGLGIISPAVGQTVIILVAVFGGVFLLMVLVFLRKRRG